MIFGKTGNGVPGYRGRTRIPCQLGTLAEKEFVLPRRGTRNSYPVTRVPNTVGPAGEGVYVGPGRDNIVT